MRIMTLLLLLSALSVCADYEFTNLIKSGENNLWTLNSAAFQQATKGKADFFYGDKSQTKFRYARSNKRGTLTFGGLNVYEALIEFDKQKISGVTLSIFNRGDGGFWSRDNLKNAAEKITSVFNELYPEIKPVEETAKVGRVNSELRTWDTANGFYQLRWSISGSGKKSFCEYLTMTISQEKPGSTLQIVKTEISSPEELKNRIKKDDNGLCHLEIPMVDQGKKGYCVVAVLERILQYYGSEFDQHQLAQLAKTSVQGTSMDNMLDAVKKVDGKLGIRMNQLYINKSYSRPHDFQIMIKDYNRAAKKVNAKRLTMQKYITNHNRSTSYNVSAFFNDLDGKVFIESRVNSERRNFTKFQQDIEKHINEGTPLVWCVILGLIPEKNTPQVAGAHMRLITGYNPKTTEISYSDSWGYGHELKTMNIGVAWAMTTSLSSITPRINN
ncbi:MAG: C39 family peptidase [Victivallaceae bacterium]|nr:C39 family peptidase [Victivallaceae bacterium]MDD4181121.1 C39 family peptidase [Victivallaceae bacterium]